ncbi:DNA-binding protein [Lentilactobacillus buchneri]|uniref:DNA-binding protein n=1 Tax=Lentilactobacillus buchneri TaxID=1581 RepID=UPI0021A67734|nr:DNA-binding protein [Lentilactobacillus buchneri]MCT2899036.1 DNA-binding protein [Lentilactobacillus buchneri]
MNNNNSIPVLLNRFQASKFLGIDVKSFDKYVRSDPSLPRFMLGRQERYVKTELIKYIHKKLIKD